MNRRHALSMFLGLVFLAGCTGGGAPDDMPELGKVTGTITLDGQPLAGVQVEFVPEKTRTSTALTDAEGKYKLMFNHENEGAAVGKHKVKISTIMTAAGADAAPGASTATIPERYNINTELTADVAAGDNTFDFKLESK